MDLRELQKAYLDNLRQVTEEKLEIGSLIRTIISVDEGLVFKDGRKQKPKKLVIIGVITQHPQGMSSYLTVLRQQV